MVAIPEVQRPPQAIVDHITQWYEQHEHTYTKVWSRLDEIRLKWQLSSKREQIALLKLSYINSVFSIRTPVHIHEEAFARFMDGEMLEVALTNAGAGLVPSRTGAMYDTFADDSLWDECVELLNDGNVDTAHKLLIDNAKYLGTAKAPFTLANLGFVQKMCVDSNVARIVGADEQPESKSVPKYEGLCADIRDMFPELSERLAPYHLQWVLFDYQRFYRAGSKGGPVSSRRSGMAVAQHNIWFDTALGNTNRIVSRIADVTREAKRRVIGDGFEAEFGDDAEIEDAIREAIESTVGEHERRREILEEIDAAIEAAD